VSPTYDEFAASHCAISERRLALQRRTGHLRLQFHAPNSHLDETKRYNSANIKSIAAKKVATNGHGCALINSYKSNSLITFHLCQISAMQGQNDKLRRRVFKKIGTNCDPAPSAPQPAA
jgi:hypothetical protein